MTSYLLVALLALAVLVKPSTYIIHRMFFTQGFTENDCMSWNPFGASIPVLKFSDCLSNRIFGGYNIFVGDPVNPNGITRTWTNLIPHYSVTVSATFYKLDSWKGNTIFFMVDGVTAHLQTFDYTNGGTTDFCGNPTPVSDSINTNFNDIIVPISFTVAHTAPTLTLRILSNLVGNSGSWGIRNLNVTMQACDQSCASCTSANACTSCNNAQGLSLVGSFCVCNGANPVRMRFIPCPFMGTPCATCYPSSVSCSSTPGYYYSTTTTNCEPCNIACGTCTSPVNSAATCGSCNTAGFIRTSLLTACFSCFSGCASCTSTAFNACTSCSYGYFRDTVANTCVQTCPNGYFSIQSTATCSPCNPPCSNCIGMNGGSYYCTSCIASYYLYNYACSLSCPNGLLGYQGICVSSCPIGTYASASFICTACVANCRQCTNGTSCFICNSGAYMDSLGLCYINCPSNQYGDNTTMLCLSCHSSCGSTCFGPFSDNCLSCPAGIILIGNVCYATCPSNTYSASCLPCHSSCLTCNGGTALNCLTCSSPLFYHLNFSSCLITCNTGEISNNFNFTCTQCPTAMVAHFQTCLLCSTTCLYCNGITFLDCTTCNIGTTLVKSTCVLSHDKTVIYMPGKPTGTSILDAFIAIFLVHSFLCLFIDAIFQYKTNLLLTIQLIQILSYTQFLTIELSQSTQKLAHFMYITNFAAFINPLSVEPHPSLPPKFQVIGKTGVFLADSFGIQLVMIVVITLFLSVKYLSNRCQFFKKVYQKINPYLITYTFRLVLLELGLDIMLYLYCFDVGSGLGVGSLVMLLIDMIAFIFSLCWRIKTEQDGTQIAMFYYNQIGQYARKEEQQVPEDEPVGTSVQQKIRKSKILPSVMQLLLKLPISITILYFIGNSSTQSICYFIYFSFYLLLVVIVPVRRRVYRLVMIMNSSFLVLNGLGAIVVARGAASNYFDGIWLTIIILLFALTLLQVITNYNYFIQCIYYFKHQVKHGFSQKEEPPNHQSQSNLASQEEQSVVFQRHDAESPYKKSKKDQSKILSKNELNNSWMQQNFDEQ